METVSPSNATNKSVTWSSSDPSVTTINNGVVTAVAAGTATITVATVDGNFADTCDVTVTALTTYTITATSGNGGTIAPIGDTNVTSGSSLTYTIIPNSGYGVSSVVVDGTNVGAISTYTFANVASNHTIAANFYSMHIPPTPEPVLNLTPEPEFTPSPLPHSPTPEPIFVRDVQDSKAETRHNVKINVMTFVNGKSKTATYVVPVIVKDMTLRVDIIQAIMDNAIKSIVEISGEKNIKTITFDFDTIVSFKSVVASFNKVSVTKLSQSFDNLVIKTHSSTISLDKNALINLASTADNGIKINATIDETHTNFGSKPLYDFIIASGKKAISDFGNGRVVITIPYTLAKSEKGNNALAYLINSNGDLEVVKTSHYDDLTKTISFATNHLSKYTISSNTASYKDVSDNEWYAPAVEYVTIREIFSGVGDNMFNPNGTMTKAMFIMALSRLDGANASIYRGSTFADVDENAWYASSIAWAKSNRLIAGNDDRIYPNQAITREEMAVILHNYINQKGIVLNVVNETPFKDFSDVNETSREAVGAMRKYGLIEGIGNITYAPKMTASRAQVAQIFSNIIKVLSR